MASAADRVQRIGSQLRDATRMAAAAGAPAAAVAKPLNVVRPTHSLKGYTVMVTGGSRGIGLAIALAAARQGANVALVAKTTTPDPRLPGTIFSAAAEVEAAGGVAEAIPCDIRLEEAVDAAIARTVARFGGLDVLINNASAISLTNSEKTPMKRFDLMHGVNVRGTYMMTAKALPHLKASRAAGRQPHVLNLGPPLNMEARWFAPHVAYTMAKYGMSMCTLGHAEEFKPYGIAVNSLWPRTAIATAAVANLLGGDEAVRRCRTADIMADAALAVLTSNSADCSGNFFVDEAVLSQVGVTDLTKYRVDPAAKEEELIEDFFL
jgi:citronellol/citronellal dehydrogenase